MLPQWRLYNLRRQLYGLCRQCNHKIGKNDSTFCKRHRKQKREHQRRHLAKKAAAIQP